MLDETREELLTNEPHEGSVGADGDSEETEPYERPRRSSLNLILVAVLLLLLIVTGVAAFFVVTTSQTAKQPQTLADVQIQQLQQQIKTSPKDQTLYLELAASYYKTKAYDKALQAISDLQRMNPTGTVLAESIYAQARITEVRGNSDAAISGYLKSIDVTETAEARWALGTLYLSNKKYDDAVKNLQRYLVLVPTDVGGFVKIGAAYEGTGDRVKALAAYKKANSYVPNEPATLAAIKRLEGQK